MLSSNSLQKTIRWPLCSHTRLSKSWRWILRVSKSSEATSFKPRSQCKKILFSVPLTYMGFVGIWIRFTNEAQVNFITAVQLSCNHLPWNGAPNRFCKWKWVNFIGFLACKKNDDLYFKYSGYSFALRCYTIGK
jgi:hypothetical protein